MGAKTGMGDSILSFRPQTHAVMEHGLEAVEIRPHYVHVLIGNQSRQALTHALPHDACFAVVYAKTLFEENGSDVYGEPLDTAFKLVTAREREVVGVARVYGSSRPRESGEPAIHAIRANVGQRGRGGSALRQMRPRMEDPRLLKVGLIGIGCGGVPDATRHGVGANATEEIGDRFRIARR